MITFALRSPDFLVSNEISQKYLFRFRHPTPHVLSRQSFLMQKTGKENKTSCYELFIGSCFALLCSLSILLRLAWDSVFPGNVTLVFVSFPKPQCTENKFLLHAVSSLKTSHSRDFQFFRLLELHLYFCWIKFVCQI